MWNFSPLSPHLWYLQALLYVLVIAFIVEHLGLEKAGISGNSGAVGRKPHKGKLFPAFCGKRRLSYLLCKELSVLRTSLFLAGLPGLEPERRLLLSCLDKKKMGLLCCVVLPGFLEYGTLWSRRWLAKSEMLLGTQEEYAGTIFLAICIFLLFIGWQNFYVENCAYQSIGKSREKTIPCLSMFLHYAVLQALVQSALKAEGCHAGKGIPVSMG